MENLKKLIESRIGNICKFQNDSKNYMDKDKYDSLKGRTDRIITAAQEIIDGLNECIEILENDIKPYLEDDINTLLSYLNKMKKYSENIQNEAQKMCNASNKYTCQECRSLEFIQTNQQFLFYYLKISSISLDVIIKELEMNLEAFDGKHNIIILLNSFTNLDGFIKSFKGYEKLDTQIRGIMRLLATKNFCIHHTEDFRKTILEKIDIYERSNGIG